MARRRKKNQELTLILIGAGALIVLIGIAISNPWSILSIAFILILLCFAVLGVMLLWKKLDTQFEQEKQYKRMGHVRSTPQMAFLTPTDFEHYVAMLYRKLGYAAEVTRQSGDGGIDIILKDKNGTAAVQVKRFLKGNVGRPDLQRLVGASLNKYDRMIFVTPSSYSREAYEYAALYGVELIDGPELEEMSKKVLGQDYIHKALGFGILERR